MIKTPSAAAIVIAMLSSPVLAQDTVHERPAHTLQHHYRNAYNRAPESELVAPSAPVGESYFDHDSYDPQRIGGRNPNFNPPS